MRLKRLCFLLLSPLAACEPWDHVVVDEGRVCLEPAEVEQFAAGDPVHVTVRLDECISACAEDAEASCTAVRVGDAIEIHSEGHWNEPTRICIAVCASL